jgi:endonuclease/exonuclease/phosphatase family metal-dependent hydrolase
VDIRLEDGNLLHVFNVHMGTSFFERREQARKLVGREILNRKALPGTRIVLGDCGR